MHVKELIELDGWISNINNYLFVRTTARKGTFSNNTHSTAPT